MTRNEQRNRSHKAIAIADTLQAVHCDSDTATALTPEAWRIAAQAAAERTGHRWADCSQATQAAVVAILVDRETPADRRRPAVVSPTTDVLASVVTALVETDGGWEPDPTETETDPHEDAFLNWCETVGIDPDDTAGRGIYRDHLDTADLNWLRR